MNPARIARTGALILCLSGAAEAQEAGRTRIEIVTAPETPAGSGRLLLFAEKIEAANAEAPASVSADPFFRSKNFVAAREVRGLDAAARIGIDGDDQAYPGSIDSLPGGDYWVQAVLDRDHDYAYRGAADAGDLISPVTRVTLPLAGPSPTLVLSTQVQSYPQWETARGPMFSAQDRAIVDQRIKPIDFVSERLSAFQGRPVVMKGLVVTPEDYDTSGKAYPVVYVTHGFTAGMDALGDMSVSLLTSMHSGRLPPMIWVLLDQSGPFGTHEFADSPNTGPWGTALTEELIPALESRYRMDGGAQGRYLMGHSSGGWAMLWLQVNNPAMFGGAWISAPDITDFTNFEGVDITRPEARIISEMGRMEAVLGEYGGQASSFEAVFSPRGDDGRPMPLYDRASGEVDPQVAAHWRETWDVTEVIRKQWRALGPDLDGKLHVWVGAEDQFGLADSTRNLELALEAVGGRGDFTYVPGRGHFDLYAEGSERQALRRVMAWQMWRLARPHSELVDPGPLPAKPPA